MSGHDFLAQRQTYTTAFIFSPAMEALEDHKDLADVGRGETDAIVLYFDLTIGCAVL